MDVAGVNIDVGSVLSGIGSLAKDIRTAITGVDPTVQGAIEQKLIEIEALGQQGQLAINLAEAQSGKAGWRNRLGNVCVAGFGYTYVIQPFLEWLCSLLGAYLAVKIPVPPTLDVSVMYTLLTGMLGLGGIKSFDLLKGTRK